MIHRDRQYKDNWKIAVEVGIAEDWAGLKKFFFEIIIELQEVAKKKKMYHSPGFLLW